MKNFFKWLRQSDDYLEEVKWIKTALKDKEVLLPDQLIAEEEMKRLVDAAESPRDKAFIMTLYESGGRIGEVGSLRIKDLDFKESYVSVRLFGKTGGRRVLLVASVPYLATWLGNHPLNEDPEAPLWVNLGTVNKYDAMSYPALAKILKSCAKRAGLRKRTSPHKLTL